MSHWIGYSDFLTYLFVGMSVRVIQEAAPFEILYTFPLFPPMA